ncbi:hypothetical protein [Streptomyces sp. NPDC086776]|uniref:hypothetical protein n=1 Tax=Streptomyces sp. NPDC086776 TaxID=3365756 RepID=UPI0037FDF24F
MLAADGAVLPGGGRLPQPVDGRIRLRGVSYGTLEDLDLDIAPGDIVGVATPDPADATALLRCLPAAPIPTAARSTCTEFRSPRSIPRRSAPRSWSAEHDADVFEGTLVGNVSAAAPLGADIGPALTASGADEVARTLPQGGSRRAPTARTCTSVPSAGEYTG